VLTLADEPRAAPLAEGDLVLLADASIAHEDIPSVVSIAQETAG
jgi:hypothetical protein